MENEELYSIINNSKIEMEKYLLVLKKKFSHIRAGKAHTSMIEEIKVEYYGSIIPLKKIANISILDAITLIVQPWEITTLSNINKAIINANIGLMPSNNGELLHIRLPFLSEEGRKELVKKVKSETEKSKIDIRNVRKNANKYLKKVKGISKDILKNIEDEIQELTNVYIKNIENISKLKEKEILTV
ncbi:MAG: ribosome recycling factor [Candidatus Bostrichicola ureolyticus]|nr:MAG: ribosome recycling factor [Candidatus Bostrichicola ureolyticus]